MKRLSFASSIALVVLGCTSTVDGTGSPGTSSSASSASSSSSGSSSSGGQPSSSSGGSCLQITGSWFVSSTCGVSEECAVTQTGCFISIDCPSGSFTGSVTSTTVTYDGTDEFGVTTTCDGDFNSSSFINGSCSLTSGESCSFTATRRPR